MSAPQFQGNQKPDCDVVDACQRILAGALRGDVRLITITAVNAVNEVETETAGDLSEIRSNVLLGGLLRATNSIIKSS